MMQTIFLGLLAAIPLSLYLWLMWRMDRYDREPVGLLLLVLAWGSVGAIAVTVLTSQGLFGNTPLEPDSPGHFLRIALGAPLIEEPAKALIFLWLFKHREFDNVTDGFVYGAAAGLGFAMTENLSYFLAAAGQGDPQMLASTIVMRTLYSALLHAGATSLVGAAFGLAKFRRRSQARVLPWIGLVAAVCMHVVWNGLLVLDKVTQRGGNLTLLDLVLFPLEFVVLLILFRRCIRYEESLLARELAGEVPEDQLPLISNYRKHGLVAVPEGVSRKEYLKACTRLAFRKEQSAMSDDPRYLEDVVFWRARLQSFRDPA